MQYDSLLTFVSSNIPYSTHIDNQIEWNYDTLANNEERQIFVRFQVPGIEHLGDTLISYCYIEPIAGDTNPGNNYDTLIQVITGAVDPNDKLVSPAGVGAEGYVLDGQKLTYTIRFQNTGTDTAFNIVIKDTLNPNMNIETFTLLASSHPVVYDIKGTGVINFIFNNILLPDSNVNEPLSHGFVKYSVEPKAGLPDFTEVTNKAYIFFDYNPPVVTNEVLNTYVSMIPVDIKSEIQNPKSEIIIYPNPTYDKVIIEFSSKEFSGQNVELKMYDLLGEEVMTSPLLFPSPNRRGAGGEVMIDISTLPAGVYFIKIQSDNDVKVGKIVKY